MTTLLPSLHLQQGEHALLGAVPSGARTGDVSGAAAKAAEKELAPGWLLRHRHAAQHRSPHRLLQVALFFLFFFCKSCSKTRFV